MKNSTQHTKEYRKRLMSNKQEIVEYLQKKTGFFVKLQVQYDKALGYRYSASVSLDSDFNKYCKWLIESTGKTNIKKELLTLILNADWKNKKNGQSLQKKKEISRRVHSTVLEIDCVNCGEKPVKCFHRNILSPLNKQRGGYSHLCFDCANARAAEILKTKNEYTAILFLCALYDRPFIKQLADEVIAKNLIPVKLFGEYMRRVSLVHAVKKSENTFAATDFFDGALRGEISL